jgi:hypothetical protein
MATQKSTRARAGASVNQCAKSAEMVPVPVLRQPYRKAPKVDPYLKPGSITTETLKFGDVELPPIQSGLEPGRGLTSNETRDYAVRVIWISRRQIDWVLSEIAHQHPELETVMHIVSKWMSRLDSMRDEMMLSTLSAQSMLKGDKPMVDYAREALGDVSAIAGSWHDEHRLHLR